MEDKKPYTEQHDINNESNTENKDNSSNGMIIGLCIGLSAGITFGLLNDSIIMGVLLGIGICLCFGTALDFGKKGTNNKDDKERGEKMSKVKIDVNNLDKFFKKGELIPAIAYEVDTKTVLMLAYMNKESLKKTLETGYTWYYSRSRQELWNKGATSGHLQKVVSIYSDCDDDTLLLNVRQTGVACHTGSYSCFFNEMYNEEDN